MAKAPISSFYSKFTSIKGRKPSKKSNRQWARPIPTKGSVFCRILGCDKLSKTIQVGLCEEHHLPKKRYYK